MNYAAEMEKSISAPVYPKITISHKDLPEAKDWQIGDTYELEIEVKMVRSLQAEGNGSFSNESTFEIRKIGVDSDEDDNEKE